MSGLKTPGWKTLSWWLTLAAYVAGAAMATGVLGDGGLVAQVVGGLVALLAQVGYTYQRTSLKELVQSAGTGSDAGPAWKATEAVLSMAGGVFGLLLVLGVVGEGSQAAQVVGGLLAATGAGGATWSRARLEKLGAAVAIREIERAIPAVAAGPTVTRPTRRDLARGSKKQKRKR